jgi:hypothetical protein
MTTANVTAITALTSTTITMPGSKSVATSKRGGTPEGSTKSIIEGRKSLVVDAMDECHGRMRNSDRKRKVNIHE